MAKPVEGDTYVPARPSTRNSTRPGPDPAPAKPGDVRGPRQPRPPVPRKEYADNREGGPCPAEIDGRIFEYGADEHEFDLRLVEDPAGAFQHVMWACNITPTHRRVYFLKKLLHLPTEISTRALNRLAFDLSWLAREDTNECRNAALSDESIYFMNLYLARRPDDVSQRSLLLEQITDRLLFEGYALSYRRWRSMGAPAVPGPPHIINQTLVAALVEHATRLTESGLFYHPQADMASFAVAHVSEGSANKAAAQKLRDALDHYVVREDVKETAKQAARRVLGLLA